MSVAPKPPLQPRVRARLLALLATGCAAVVLVAACSSIESTSFSDGTCVGSGCEATVAAGSSAASSTGGPCSVDATCAVSFKTDIFAGMLDTPAAGCTLTGTCHGSGMGSLQLTAGMPAEAYSALTGGFKLAATPGPAKTYIVPCDKADSGMLCNMKTDADAGANPFGSCGSLMPLLGTNLTTDQIDKIATWIACGAPDN